MKKCNFKVSSFDDAGIGLVRLDGKFKITTDNKDYSIKGEVWLDPDEVDTSALVLYLLESAEVEDTIN